MNFKKYVALFFVTSVALMVVALYNGFPLVQPDTGAYIDQAFSPRFRPEHMPFYSMFVRITCLWTSLWFTIFVQCLILAYLVLKFIRLIGGDKSSDPDSGFNFSLIAVISIISFTCVSWVVSCVVPDVFGAILLLASVLFISDTDIKRRSQAMYLFFVFLAMLMHNAHFPILVLFSLILLVWAFVKKRQAILMKSTALLAICVVVWGLMCGMNVVKKHGFTFSRGTDVMLVAKFAETGILDAYLNDNCGKKPLQMCHFKDHVPGNINQFLTSGGPVYTMGGWDSSREECKNIVGDVLTTPRYLSMFAAKSVTGTLKQLTQVQAPDKVVAQGGGSEAWEKIKEYFADALPAYSTSLQNGIVLSGSSCNFVYYLFFVLSSLWTLLFYGRVMNKELAFIYGAIILFLVVNAFVTASLSAITYRFQYRVAWLLPAANAIVILKYYYHKEKKQTA